MMYEHSGAAIGMDIPPRAVSEIVILRLPVMWRQFGMDCRILLSPAPFRERESPSCLQGRRDDCRDRHL
jgi:hypothetical protein